MAFSRREAWRESALYEMMLDIYALWSGRRMKWPKWVPVEKRIYLGHDAGRKMMSGRLHWQQKGRP